MTPTEYEEALEWLYSQVPNYQTDGRKAYKPGLENIAALCEFYGNPQEKLRMIHIGGTNGKGSTSNMLASVLQEAGYSVGLYTSPHLIDFTERIKVNGENCNKNFVFDFIKRLKSLPDSIKPSFFEFTSIMAFEYFRQKNVDFAIIEVGLGGRLDSTNIITPIVSAITNVALDHTDILGDTVEKIAAEKAGIIKQNIPVISGEENASVKNIIREKALSKAADFIDATAIETDMECSLSGNYQRKNIRVVMALAAQLRLQNIPISDENIKNGLLNVQQNTHFMGRWQQFSQQPLIILDTAHNLAGLREVFAQLDAMPQSKHIILGFVNDKKIDEVLTVLPKNSVFYFAKPNVARGREPSDYEAQLKDAGISYSLHASLQGAYLTALQNVKENDMLFIGGSNFIVGEFLKNNLEE